MHPNTKALATNEINDGDSDEKDYDRLAIKDDKIETDCTGTGTYELTESMEGSTITD